MLRTTFDEACLAIVYVEQELAAQVSRRHPELHSLLKMLREVRGVLEAAGVTPDRRDWRHAAQEQAQAIRSLQEYVSGLFPRALYLETLLGQLDLISHQLEAAARGVERLDPVVG